MTAPLAHLAYAQRLAVWAAYLALSGALLHSQRARAPGLPRLAVALLLTACNFCVPFLFDPDAELCTNIVAAFGTMWMSSFKALAWVLNRGALTLPLSTTQFLVVYAFPIIPATVREPVAGGATSADDPQAKDKPSAPYRLRLAPAPQGWAVARENLANFLTKCVAISGMAYALANFHLPRLVHTFLCGMGLYCFLGMLMDGPTTLATAVIGLPIAPHFDEPFRSTSLSEVWSKRWNLAAGSVLHSLIYAPISSGRLVHDPSAPPARKTPLRRAAAVCATFVASGLMHEIIFWNFAHRFSGYWLAFFSVFAPLIILEGAGKALLKKCGLEVPTWLATPLAVLTFVLVSHFLFLPDINRVGITDKVVDHIWSSAAVLGRWVVHGTRAVEGGWVMLDVAAPAIRPV